MDDNFHNSIFYCGNFAPINPCTLLRQVRFWYSCSFNPNSGSYFNVFRYGFCNCNNAQAKFRSASVFQSILDSNGRLFYFVYYNYLLYTPHIIIL